MMKPPLIFTLLILCSCKPERKFDRELWNDDSDRGLYENRNAMLDDLLENHQLKGMNLHELEELFGYIDSISHRKKISFEVYQEWDGIDPSYTKYLNLRLNKDRIVDSVYISEYQR